MEPRKHKRGILAPSCITLICFSKYHGSSGGVGSGSSPTQITSPPTAEEDPTEADRLYAMIPEEHTYYVYLRSDAGNGIFPMEWTWRDETGCGVGYPHSQSPVLVRAVHRYKNAATKTSTADSSRYKHHDHRQQHQQPQHSQQTQRKEAISDTDSEGAYLQQPYDHLAKKKALLATKPQERATASEW